MLLVDLKDVDEVAREPESVVLFKDSSSSSNNNNDEEEDVPPPSRDRKSFFALHGPPVLR